MDRSVTDDGVPPEVSRKLELAHTTATLGLFAVWFYQGLVPKVLMVDQGELDVWIHFGLSTQQATVVTVVGGVLEMIFAILLLVFRNRRWPFVITILAMAGLLAGVLRVDPAIAGAAYNPVGVNIAMIALAIVALVSMPDRPTTDHPRE